MQQTPKPSRRVWRRRALSLLLALVMVLGLVPVFPAAEASAHWADTYLTQLVEWGFIRADQANNPDRALTRADFMSIVNRAYGYHEEGETPFEDIKETDWFYDDVGIAYTARYINGTSPTTASPNNPLTRETAATILGRNMMLQESPGELVDFTDAHQISTWASGIIKSSMEHYLIGGYNDGTFRPRRNVSWGEMASMLTSLVGTPLQEPGEYSLGGVYGNVTITSPDVTLRDTVISGDLYISGGVGLGGIVLENVTVLGRIVACGTGQAEGGQCSILLRNVTADELLVDNLQDHYVSLRADGITEIGRTTVRTSAYIEDNTPDGLGLHYISLEGESYPEGEEPEDWVPIQLDLAGRIEEVVNRTPRSQVRVGAGTVAKLTVDETAEGSNVIIDRGAVVKELNLDTATPVTGEGDIEHLVVNAPGCEVEMLPDEIDIRPGITAVIAGEEMDTVGAKESSEQPMILAGYPEAQDIVPTGLDAAFMTNKAGTVYWAVTAITDGSVGEEDLIKPPSYGNLAVAHGSVKVLKGNEETISKVTGLTPGGSYYLSAILVDARGQRSTVKVISFTTPDNTVPAFCAGYPKMSKVSRTDSVVVVMPNKDCKLYYALLPEGATAPTENELKSNAVSGALGYGVRDVKKNVEDTFRVNDVILDEQTTYVLYLWLTDADGINKGKIVSLKFTTADETPPWFIVDPTPNKVDKTSVTLTFRLNENGTVYWVAVPAGTVYPKPEPGTDYETAPPNSEYGKLQIASGMNIGADGKSGKVTAKENVDGTISVSGLKPETAYDFYYVAQDTAGNYSEIWKKITINTLDTNGPKVTQSFSKTSGTDKTKDPMSSTDIYLDFSENVRYTGTNGGKGFLELYQDVKSTNKSATAVNLLANNLFGAIKLHKINIQDNSEETIRWNTTAGAPFTEDMTIDYTQATVEALKEGGIRVTFPNSALHLENGGQYYFTIGDITDTSNNQNSISPDPVDFWTNEATSKANGHNVPPFVVEFAAVNLTSPGVGAGDGPYNKHPSTGEVADELARVDLSFRMTPTSTSTVSDSVSYDVLLWTNSVLTFDLYYRVVDEMGKAVDYSDAGIAPYLMPRYLDRSQSGGNDTADANGWFYLGNSGDVNPSVSNGYMSGRSINKFFNGCDPTSFPQLNKLNEKLRYEFVIKLESLDGNKDFTTWNGEVKFYVNVAAGQSSNLDNLGGSLTPKNWEDALKKGMSGGARSIGRWNNYDNQLVDTQELSRLFTDSRLPRFDNETPKFETDERKSDTVTLVLNLTTPGTVYYAIGKAEAGSAGGQKLPEITTIRRIMDVDMTLIPGGTGGTGGTGTDGDNTGDGNDGDTDNAGGNTGGEDGTDTGETGSTGGNTDGEDGSGDSTGGDEASASQLSAQAAPTPRAPGDIVPVNDNPIAPGNLMYVTTDGPNPPQKGGTSIVYPITKTPWMIGGNDIQNTVSEDTAELANLLESPTPLNIFNPSGWTDGRSAITGNVTIPGVSVVRVPVSDLQPDTVYYAYFVIKGEADTLSHVYLYQFRTPEASKPKILLNPQDNGDMEMSLDVATNGYYRVFALDDAEKISILAQPFNTYVDDADKPNLPTLYSGDDFTVLDALTTAYKYADASYGETGKDFPNRDGVYTAYDEGYTVFDMYASERGRSQIYDLIRQGRLSRPEEINGTVNWGAFGSTSTLAPTPPDEWAETMLGIGKNLSTSRYVFLTYAINKSVVTTGSNGNTNAYMNASFSGVDYRKGDLTPPEVTDVVGGLSKDSTGNTYSGQVVIQFDKDVYLYNANGSNAVSITETNLTAPGNVTKPTHGSITPSSISSSSFTLTINSVALNDMLRFPVDYFANQNNIKSPKPLRIQVIQDKDTIYLEVEWGTGTDKDNDGVWRFPLTDVPAEDHAVRLTDNQKPTLLKGTQSNLTLTLEAGAVPAGYEITAALDPADMDTEMYTWTLSEGGEDVINMTGTGDTRRITAASPGKTTITVKGIGVDENGNTVVAENNIDVIVMGAVTGINTTAILNGAQWSAGVLTLPIGGTDTPSAELTATVTGGGLTDSAKLDCVISPATAGNYVNISVDGTKIAITPTRSAPKTGTATVTVSLIATDGTSLTKKDGSTTFTINFEDGAPAGAPSSDGPGAISIKPVTPTGLTFSNVSGARLSGSTMKMSGTSLSSTIKATISPSGATGTITWTSSNPKVASVVSSGTGGAQAKITGLTAGTATITAKVGSVERSFTVTVSPSVTISSFTANSTASTLTKGTDGTYTWTRKSGTSCAATLKFTTGMSLDNATVTVTSSDTKAVSVGKVTKSGTTGQVQLTFGSMNTSGQVTITVKAGSVTQSFKIKLVGSDVSAVNIAPKK